MENLTHNDSDVPDGPASAKLEPTQSADAKEFNEFDVTFEVQSGLLGSLARLVGNPGAISMAGIQAAVSLLQHELPASYGYVAMTTSADAPVADIPAADVPEDSSIGHYNSAQMGRHRAPINNTPESSQATKHHKAGLQ
ncbi:hypothetical protein GGI09_001214, partial [Coemansia sp. S100]